MGVDFNVLDKFNGDKAFSMVEFGNGAKLLEVELNEMQKIQRHALAEFYRSQMNSGVIDFPAVIPGASTLNGFTIPAFTALVNGYKIKVSNAGGKTDGTNLITLPDPPTSGTRDDLVFLEAWFEEIDATEVIKQYGNADGSVTIANDIMDTRLGAETTRRIQLKWRIRTVAGVNFTTYPEGLGDIATVKAQGANITSAAYTFTLSSTDKGLYTSGDGSSTSKSALLTYDGYSYAIPLFRIKRRNSGGYSPSNFSGAMSYVTYTPSTNNTVVQPGYTIQLTFTSTNGLYIGQYLNRTVDGLLVQVVSVDSTTKATVVSLYAGPMTLGSGYPLAPLPDRPDALYSNVIDSRDITDLRHRVQAQFNYDYELKRGFDQFMRGEIGPNKKMMKTYHGLPKSQVDEHTVFYCDLDGQTTSSIGTATLTGITSPVYKTSPVGAALSIPDSGQVGFSFDAGLTAFTFDTWFKTDELFSIPTNNPVIIELSDSTRTNRIGLVKNSSGQFMLEYGSGGNTATAAAIIKPVSSYTHIRMRSNGNVLVVLFNGVQVLSYSTVLNLNLMTTGRVGLKTSGWGYTGSVSDVHISNIDRGALFSNLPADIISGDAVIMPKFTAQRKILSEAQMVQTVNGLVSVGGATNTTRGITTSKASGNWASGDTVTVIGMAGELISGVFDTDTALATIVKDQNTGDTSLTVDSVTGLAVNDTFQILDRQLGTLRSTVHTVTAISGTTLTISPALTASISKYQSLIMETTATSSVPLVSFLNSGTKTSVVGTWSGLGTNQSVFTLGTNASLTTQDMQIDYSLVMPAGQPALPAPTTTTLAGEAGIRIPSSMQTITADFSNKLVGSTWENPNIYKVGLSNPTALLAPSAFLTNYERDTPDYTAVSMQDGTINSWSATASGGIAQALFSFDLIKIVERKLGCKIPAKDTAGKVAWLKANIDHYGCRWYGYGSSPAGSKATIALYYNSAWLSVGSNSTNTPNPTSDSEYSKSNIDSNGFIYYLAYADPSDGTTPSVINTDYVSLSIAFASKVLNSYKLVTGQTVHVRDDFAGKISGSVVECPNLGKNCTTQSSLLAPSSLSWVEFISGYTQINSLDGVLSNGSNSSNGGYGQQLFSFNLICIFEDKYGTIPAIDKVQWLKDNLSQIVCNWWGYGTGPAGNKATFARWDTSSPSWLTQNSHTLSSVSKLISSSTTTIPTTIDSSGMCYFIAYTDPSDGVTASTIYTDYVNIELTLKTPTSYDLLPPDNPRRDAGMSSILAVRKETKEVQTLFGRDMDLNLVTYADYLPAPDPISANNDITILAEIPEFLITDLGSSVGMKQGVHHWMNPAYRVRQDNDNLYGELGFSSLPLAVDSINANTGSKIKVNSGTGANLTQQTSMLKANKPTVFIYRALCLINGELKILIISVYSFSYLNLFGPGTAVFLISLNGKPLSKENDGLVRSGWFSDNPWRTSPLVAEGFVDKATNKLITTGNSI